MDSISFNPPRSVKLRGTVTMDSITHAILFQSAPQREAAGNTHLATAAPTPYLFQSAPQREAAGNGDDNYKRNAPMWFQSAPQREAAGNNRPRVTSAIYSRFNPPRSVKLRGTGSAAHRCVA